ncbi:MAG: phosphate transport system regulatory protein PhoU [Verrucomicrobia bacterium GWF2_62_7]|nr:MAG: phosphate transport system regulatory protein PhoU [Verrucomicrobia bacterium GWF2_62_7]
MELHFDQELAQLKEKLLFMSSLTEQSVAQSLKAMIQRDDALAKKVDADDDVLDRLQVEVDERCIRLLALRQPLARDLRLITMAMKISTDLERIGDQAANIARRAAELNKEPELKPLVDIPRMAEICQGMIRDVLDAFVYEKPDLARQIIKRDEDVDRLNKQLQRELTSFMIEDPATITRALLLMRIARNLERIGDHATNIAEEIVYLYEALDIRHQH